MEDLDKSSKGKKIQDKINLDSMYGTPYNVEAVVFEVIQTPEFEEWFEELEAKSKVFVQARIQRISEFGHFRDHKRFDSLIELRWKSGLRIYSAVIGRKVYLLIFGGNKHGQQRDIEKAKKILKRETEKL